MSLSVSILILRLMGRRLPHCRIMVATAPGGWIPNVDDRPEELSKCLTLDHELLFRGDKNKLLEVRGGYDRGVLLNYEKSKY